MCTLSTSTEVDIWASFQRNKFLLQPCALPWLRGGLVTSTPPFVTDQASAIPREARYDALRTGRELQTGLQGARGVDRGRHARRAACDQNARRPVQLPISVAFCRLFEGGTKKRPLILTTPHLNKLIHQATAANPQNEQACGAILKMPAESIQAAANWALVA